MKFLADLEKRNRPLQLFLGLVLILAIGVIDFVTGYELAFSLFYVLPIALITWLTDRRFGLAASVISAIVWLVADLASQHVYSNPLIPIWNTLIRLAFFVIITLLLSALRMALQRESELARVDYLTGALNSRYFYDLAQREIDLFQRYQHPFTLAYLDLDNFKAVNDQLGHATGDQVLRKVVSSVKANLRKTDMVARMGGDEFVMLLPETNQKSAEVVLSRLQLHLLEEMHNNDWQITFSTGVLTCTAAPDSPDGLVMLADDLMYAAKHDGKNTFKFMTYSG
jgi:diguanylate cyclase (GGDEF)-like protein